jgi:hypothetical protein
MNKINNVYKKLKDLNFFQIEVIEDIEFEGKIYKNIKQRNNNSIITTDNWNELKDVFFTQRMESYKPSYSIIEKINLELETIENLTIDKTDYKILKDRYKSFLLDKQQPLQQNESIKTDEVKKELHYNIFTDNAFYVWQRLFESFNITGTQRTDLRFMYEIMKYNGQIHKSVTVKNITDWINETYNFSIDKLQYTSIKDKSNENRMTIYNLIK